MSRVSSGRRSPSQEPCQTSPRDRPEPVPETTPFRPILEGTDRAGHRAHHFLRQVGRVGVLKAPLTHVPVDQGGIQRHECLPGLGIAARRGRGPASSAGSAPLSSQQRNMTASDCSRSLPVSNQSIPMLPEIHTGSLAAIRACGHRERSQSLEILAASVAQADRCSWQHGSGIDRLGSLVLQDLRSGRQSLCRAASISDRCGDAPRRLGFPRRAGKSSPPAQQACERNGEGPTRPSGPGSRPAAPDFPGDDRKQLSGRVVFDGPQPVAGDPCPDNVVSHADELILSSSGILDSAEQEDRSRMRPDREPRSDESVAAPETSIAIVNCPRASGPDCVRSRIGDSENPDQEPRVNPW